MSPYHAQRGLLGSPRPCLVASSFFPEKYRVDELMSWRNLSRNSTVHNLYGVQVVDILKDAIDDVFWRTKNENKTGEKKIVIIRNSQEPGSLAISDLPKTRTQGHEM